MRRVSVVPRLPTAKASAEAVVEFADNTLLPLLFGAGDRHLHAIESALAVTLTARGNRIAIAGPADAVERARIVLGELHERLKRGFELEPADIEALIGVVGGAEAYHPLATLSHEPAIRTRKRQIAARTPGQADYIRTLRDNALTFGIGPAGTGKTYLAVATAVDMLMAGRVARIILSRPAVEAGERLGFLPGDLKEKVDPYLRPLYDALHDMLPHEQVVKRLANGDIEVAPLAFMRGRTLAHAFVILDEAQNTTPVQMKMFLTRLGEGSVMAITGDLTQIDLPKGQQSGLTDALDTLDGVEGIGIVRLTEIDVVRHALVRRIVQAYERRTAARSRPE
jgi:phosphate starvation-inducible PhoH-like protein